MSFLIKVGARNSPLSRAQVQEVLEELRAFHPEVIFEAVWVETSGDKDHKTSLKTLEKTDFFTKEIDLLQLSGGCRISVHSAKDLPDPLALGLSLIALTKGVDSSDVIVLRDKEVLENLPLYAKIGTSSARREKNIQRLREDLVCVDIRGNIGQRLSLLDAREVDGVVIAEAALIRLNLTHRTRIPILGETTPLQGRLAVLARKGDEEMANLFKCVDARNHENHFIFGN